MNEPALRCFAARKFPEKNFRMPLEAKRCNPQLRYIPENPTEEKMSPKALHVAAARVPISPLAAGVTPDDVDTEWLDDMVKRLFKELNRQMCRLENLKEGAGTAPDRTANARTLSSLERTLERLSRMEREREALREKKVAKKNDEARDALVRRLDQLLAAGSAPKIPE